MITPTEGEVEVGVAVAGMEVMLPSVSMQRRDFPQKGLDTWRMWWEE